VVPAARDKKTEAELRELMSNLSRFRDLQVQQYLLSNLPNLKETGSEIRQELAYLEFRTRPQLINKLKNFPLKRIQKRIEGLAARLGPGPLSPSLMRLSTKRLVRFFDQAHDELRLLGSRIEPQRPETIHRLRVALKKYRYLAEAVAPLRLNPDERGMAKMHELQGLMGDIQDLWVLGRRLRDRPYPADGLLESINRALRVRIDSFLPRLADLESFKIYLKNV